MITGKNGRELYPVFPEDKKELERILKWTENKGKVKVLENVYMGSPGLGSLAFTPEDAPGNGNWRYRDTGKRAQRQHLLIFRRVQARGDVFGYNSRGLKAAERYAEKLLEQEGSTRSAPMGQFYTAFIPEVMWYKSELRREDGSPVGSISGYQVVEWSAIEDPEDLPFECPDCDCDDPTTDESVAGECDCSHHNDRRILK